MKWFSTLSQHPDTARAIEEVAIAARRALRGQAMHLAVVFASTHHAEARAGIGAAVAEALDGPLVLGCSARSVIGGGHEVEEEPGLALTVAHLPDVQLHPFHLGLDDLPESLEEVSAWRAALGVRATPTPCFVVLPDPFSFDAERLLRGFDAAYPGSQVVGGLPSGGRRPGEHALYLGKAAHRSGCVGVAFQGEVVMDTIVAQGCRPIGTPLFVTRCHRNQLLELDGKPALEVLRELHTRLGPADQELFQTSLFLGLGMRNASEYRQGDFLVRNLLGADEETDTLTVGAILRPNQVVQFHLRDARTSAEDLERHLVRHRDRPVARPEGALLFSCLGRGAHLYGRADHDTDAFRRHLGEVALGGFFCNGEIGPVEGATFLHGYTSAFGLFRKP